MLSAISSWATHNRAGEITYEHLNNLTYRITITTCTKSSVIADRQWLKIDWGDVIPGATLDSLERESIQLVPGMNAQINVYKGTHTFNGPGIYVLSVEDPNRNESVINIPGSVNVPFCIQSTLIIDPQAGPNNSVQLLNSAKGEACIFKPYYHNPGAYDPDGDLLTYSIISCKGGDADGDNVGCDPIAGYQFPNEIIPINNSFSIDPVTGEVTWDAPQQAGEYNIAILIEEWRWVAGQLIKVGDVTRDMQITVVTCANNPPEWTEIQDTCVEAGSNIQFLVNATDPDGDIVSLQAIGGPMTEVEHQASFSDIGNGVGQFSWTPLCEEIRLQPYQIVFKAEDNALPVQLTDLMTWFITVVGPAVENPLAEAVGNAIQLNWDENPCIDAFSNAQIGQGSYKIYRRNGLYGFEPDYCELGVPDGIGYELVGTVQGLNNTSYLDDFGVFYGGQYCYMVVTCFPDGAISYASEEFCAEIIKDVPVMTNVSILNTSSSDGNIYVAWSPPNELDTLEAFPGPYYYRVLYGEGYSGANTEILVTTPQEFLVNPDTTFIHTGLNTLDNPHNYQVEIYSGDDLVAFSSEASSIYLELIPDDNQLTLVMNHQVPWINESYEVFRYNDVLADFESIGFSNEPLYTDTGLVNNQSYCYKVQSQGTYNASMVIDPIFNDSQEKCGIPYDLTPPCTPDLEVTALCEEQVSELVWSNPNNICSDDVIQYNLYYSPTDTGMLELLETFYIDSDTTFTFNLDGLMGTIAGCFAVSALDSLLPGPDGNLVQNESEWSQIICVDNCPYYFLPNVFTPNGDGQNDEFVPFPYKFVESIELQIFNRWGGVVFETTDPEIGWDGTHKDSGEACSDGVYYYAIKVNTIRLTGIVPENFSGHIQLIDGVKPLQE
jgi:gliding motility-associated-like protein